MTEPTAPTTQYSTQTEQMMDAVAFFIEATVGYLAKLTDQGFSEHATKVMVVDFHRALLVGKAS